MDRHYGPPNSPRIGILFAGVMILVSIPKAISDHSWGLAALMLPMGILFLHTGRQMSSVNYTANERGIGVKTHRSYQWVQWDQITKVELSAIGGMLVVMLSGRDGTRATINVSPFNRELMYLMAKYITRAELPLTLRKMAPRSLQCEELAGRYPRPALIVASDYSKLTLSVRPAGGGEG